MGFRAVLVEGNPKNYNPRGFITSHHILPNIHCLSQLPDDEGSIP